MRGALCKATRSSSPQVTTMDQCCRAIDAGAGASVRGYFWKNDANNAVIRKWTYAQVPPKAKSRQSLSHATVRMVVFRF